MEINVNSTGLLWAALTGLGLAILILLLLVNPLFLMGFIVLLFFGFLGLCLIMSAYDAGVNYEKRKKRGN